MMAIVSSAPHVRAGADTTSLVAVHVARSMYLYPPIPVLYGPQWSMAIRLDGTTSMGRVEVCGTVPRLGLACWHVGHCLRDRVVMLRPMDCPGRAVLFVSPK